MQKVQGERWRVAKTLGPAQPGALKLTRRYGDALVCVRYRIDPQGHKRYTTVELVIEEAPIQHRPVKERLVMLRLYLGESELRSMVMARGAKWSPSTKLWTMTYQTALAMGLTSRIQPASP